MALRDRNAQANTGGDPTAFDMPSGGGQQQDGQQQQLDQMQQQQQMTRQLILQLSQLLRQQRLQLIQLLIQQHQRQPREHHHASGPWQCSRPDRGIRLRRL